MASIRRKGPKYQVQIRRKGYRSINHSFHTLKDAQAWARHLEVKADRQDLPADPNLLKALTLGQLIIRYRDTVSSRKRTAPTERIVLNAFLRRPICSLRLSELRTADFSAYRDSNRSNPPPSPAN